MGWQEERMGLRAGLEGCDGQHSDHGLQEIRDDQRQGFRMDSPLLRPWEPERGLDPCRRAPQEQLEVGRRGLHPLEHLPRQASPLALADWSGG